MPQIIPIRDLKKTAEISDMCHNSEEPIYITKNGYGDMVIMSMETYEKNMRKYLICRLDWFRRLLVAPLWLVGTRKMEICIKI